MIDMHSHLIFGVDDGSPTLEKSIKMVEQARKLGIETIIATPHFQENLFELEGIQEHFLELQEKTQGMGVNLKIGSEVSVNPFLPDLVQKNPLLRLNRSMYILLELPYDSIPVYTYDTVYRLQLQKFVPIIAHPERNMNLLKDFEEFVTFMERGCLMQVDAGSIAGAYGSSVQSFAEKLVRLNMVHFIASDAHCAEDYKEWIPFAYKKVSSWGGREYADKLFLHNPRLILENVQESIYEMI